jgi:hypothetical protein
MALPVVPVSKQIAIDNGEISSARRFDTQSHVIAFTDCGVSLYSFWHPLRDLPFSLANSLPPVSAPVTGRSLQIVSLKPRRQSRWSWSHLCCWFEKQDGLFDVLSASAMHWLN